MHTDAVKPQWDNVHLFTVTIKGCDKNQAAKVIIERVDPPPNDQDFEFTIEWEASEFDQDVPIKNKVEQIDRKIAFLRETRKALEDSTLPDFDALDTIIEEWKFDKSRYWVIDKRGSPAYRFSQRPKALGYAKNRNYFLFDRRKGEIIMVSQVNDEDRTPVEKGVIGRKRGNQEV
jgi:hypothetical protein